MTAELIEYLRAHVRYEGMPATARAAMEEAADALASKEEEIAALKGALALVKHEKLKLEQALQGDADV